MDLIIGLSHWKFQYTYSLYSDICRWSWTLQDELPEVPERKNWYDDPALLKETSIITLGQLCQWSLYPVSTSRLDPRFLTSLLLSTITVTAKSHMVPVPACSRRSNIDACLTPYQFVLRYTISFLTQLDLGTVGAHAHELLVVVVVWGESHANSKFPVSLLSGCGRC